MKYFSIKEFEHSDTAERYNIDNTVTDKTIKDNIVALVDNVLDPLRDRYGKPIMISSGYRSFELNKKIGGSRTSQHCKGQAADLYTNEGVKGLRELVRIIIDDNLKFDQLIFEHSGRGYWLHVSYTRTGVNRRQYMIYDNGTYTTYRPEEMRAIVCVK